MHRWNLRRCAFLILGLALVVAIGCRSAARSRAMRAASGVSEKSAAAAMALDYQRYLAYGGAALMLFGVLAVAAGKRGAGLTMIAGGGAMAAYFHNLAVAPWLNVTAGVLALALLTAWLGYRLWRAVKVQRELVLAIDKNPIAKSDIGEGDVERRELVRKEIAPIKEALRREGAIE